MIGVAPGIKQELIECYFDSQDLGVISVTLPEQGKAVVKLTGLKGQPTVPLKLLSHSVSVWSISS